MAKQARSVTLDPRLIEAIDERRRKSPTIKSFSAVLEELAAKGAGLVIP